MNTIMFNVETMRVKDGHELRGVTPNSSGIYKDVPVMVLGIPSRNRSMYDVASTVKQITDSTTSFNMTMTEGSLCGEFGHPFTQATQQQTIERMLVIDPTKVSHAILNVKTQPSENGKFILVTADIKCIGPYGKFLDESFRDNDRNTAFSLRSLTDKPVNQGGMLMKKMMALITFDAVGGSGYEQASKRYMPALEHNISFEAVMASKELKACIGMESNDVGELYDMLGVDRININGKTELFDGTSIIDGKYKKSLFNEMFK